MADPAASCPFPGYDTTEHFDVVARAQVVECKHPDTLIPEVGLWITRGDGTRVAFVFSVQMAEVLAIELAMMAKRSRERHWEPLPLTPLPAD